MMTAEKVTITSFSKSLDKVTTICLSVPDKFSFSYVSLSNT